MSLHPARRPMETFTSPVIACTQLQAADTGPADTDADQSVSMGCQGLCHGWQGVGGSPQPSSRREGQGLGHLHPLPTRSLS